MEWKDVTSGEFQSGNGRIKTLRNIWAVGILFILVLGSIYMGWATPDEAAGVGVMGAILVLIQRRKFSWANLVGAAIDCAKASAMLFLLCGTATIVTQFLSVTRVISTLTGWMAGLGLPFWLLLVILTCRQPSATLCHKASTFDSRCPKGAWGLCPVAIFRPDKRTPPLYHLCLRKEAGPRGQRSAQREL